MSTQITRCRRWQQRALAWLFAAIGVSLTLRTYAQPSAALHSTLPIKQITLFTSGVAYTERAGAVDGSSAVPLIFRTGEINDILKSLVLIDHGGKVQPATYASKDPITRTLQGFAVDVSDQQSVTDLLGKLRGTKVSVERAGKPAINGQIMGVEDRQIGGDENRPINDTYLSLLTDSGITSIRLGQEQTVRILDERLNRELQEALTTLAGSRDNARRQVTLHFEGAGRREVHVAYVMEAPIWKISYRLVLGTSPGNGAQAKPYLQGWALVENTSDEDWNGIRLSLVSGRPVSFIQDLYQPLYIPRPEVGPDIVASPYPQTHDENLQADRGNSVPRVMAEAGSVAKRAPEASLRKQPEHGGVSATVLNINDSTIIINMGLQDGITVGDKMQIFRDVGNGSRVPVGEILVERAYAHEAEAQVVSNLGGIRPEDIAEVIHGQAGGRMPALTTARTVNEPEALSDDSRKSVSAQASGRRAGEMFAYNITSPLSLPRGQAAMIPVIAQDIAADRISIYNAQTDGLFAMNALRIHNTTALHLKGGPITLFDGGAYAGDAKMEDIPPGDSRIVSYAVDLGVLCSRATPSENAVKTVISVRCGQFTKTQRILYETDYTLKSRLNKPRTVLVEHPYEPGSKLVEPPKATERSSSVYRFTVTLPAGKSQNFKVVTEKHISSTIAISDISVDSIFEYIRGGDVSAKLKAELQGVVHRRKQIDDLKAQSAAKTAAVKTIDDDQDRIRKNMGALDHSSALYRRYVSELDAQETAIAALRLQEKNLDRQAAAAENALRGYEDKLTD